MAAGPPHKFNTCVQPDGGPHKFNTCVQPDAERLAATPDAARALERAAGPHQKFNLFVRMHARLAARLRAAQGGAVATDLRHALKPGGVRLASPDAAAEREALQRIGGLCDLTLSVGAPLTREQRSRVRGVQALAHRTLRQRFGLHAP